MGGAPTAEANTSNSDLYTSSVPISTSSFLNTKIRILNIHYLTGTYLSPLSNISDLAATPVTEPGVRDIDTPTQPTHDIAAAADGSHDDRVGQGGRDTCRGERRGLIWGEWLLTGPAVCGVRLVPGSTCHTHNFTLVIISYNTQCKNEPSLQCMYHTPLYTVT